MARPLRYYTPGLLIEVTMRTVHGRHLLQPSRQLNRVVLGVIGRAQKLYGVRIYALVVMSNHMHMILSGDQRSSLVSFMTYINSNIAKEVGRFRRWPERFWGRRYRSIPILDNESLLGRLRYIFAHGHKEGLVTKGARWRGIHSVGAWCHGRRLIGTWLDRTRMFRDRRAGRRLSQAEYETEYEVVLTPPPGLEGLSTPELRAMMTCLVAAAYKEYPPKQAAGRRRRCRHPIGRVDPHYRPKKVARRPAPMCHTTEPGCRALYRQSYERFVGSVRSHSKRLRSLILTRGDEGPVRFFATVYAIP